MLTEEHIKNQFITNPDWEEVFLKHYPDFTPETYIDNARELFKVNGYSITEETKYKSAKFSHIVEATLWKGDEFIFGLVGTRNSIVEQIIVSTICEYSIDFSKFK